MAVKEDFASVLTFPHLKKRARENFMQGKSNRIFLNLLMILAFVGAGISPACKFISGQTAWMEICGAGGAEKILVDSSQYPSGKEQHKEIKEACAFCFFGTNIKPHIAGLIDIQPPKQISSAIHYASVDVTLREVAYASSYPRGPPALL